jgi:hypothetical protein
MDAVHRREERIVEAAAAGSGCIHGRFPLPVAIIAAFISTRHDRRSIHERAPIIGTFPSHLPGAFPMKAPLLLVPLLAGLLLAAGGGAQARTGTMTCKMSYTLTGWSIIYKHVTGGGTVHCNNGQSMSVRLSAKGGGLTVGKYKVHNGFGQFSGVRNIRDVLGTYASAGADAAAGPGVTSQAMSKGDVSLALSGTGEGVNLGVAITGFTISR